MEISEYIGDFTVFLVKSTKDENGRLDKALAGSGTLISVGNVRAILTADHVLDYIANEKDIGLAFPCRFESQKNHVQLMILEMEYVRSLTIKRGPIKSEGPDLGILVLPEIDANRIGLKGSFYNLINRQNRMLKSPPSAVDSGNWILSGAAGEWTKDLPPEQHYSRVKQFRGCAGLGIVTAAYAVGDYDILDFEAKHISGYQGPKSFGGFSGGGLWEVLLDKKDEGFEVLDKFLSGVAFYQSNIEKDRSQFIRCNGRRSIYKHVIEALQK